MFEKGFIIYSVLIRDEWSTFRKLLFLSSSISQQLYVRVIQHFSMLWKQDIIKSRYIFAVAVPLCLTHQGIFCVFLMIINLLPIKTVLCKQCLIMTVHKNLYILVTQIKTFTRLKEKIIKKASESYLQSKIHHIYVEIGCLTIWKIFGWFLSWYVPLLNMIYRKFTPLIYFDFMLKVPIPLSTHSLYIFFLQKIVTFMFMFDSYWSSASLFANLSLISNSWQLSFSILLQFPTYYRVRQSLKFCEMWAKLSHERIFFPIFYYFLFFLFFLTFCFFPSRLDWSNTWQFSSIHILAKTVMWFWD